MSAEAREAVARALTFDLTDQLLAALKPLIAAEIRAWAERQRPEVDWMIKELGVPETASGMALALNNLDTAADTIASRICGDQ